MYVQVRALENRIPILAANVENRRFGGESIMIDLAENNKVVKHKTNKIKKGENSVSKEFQSRKNIKKVEK